eukprot:gnl/MRDRNA2_/MRDRNA2_105406_c0_seq1.p1 gnl/MRDRNA2_/MRDRNA2_105406_c0~~gnl/MRDRNA2_/MRDRNA2_105406_c0_seq1.p1  ORF type:complete len:295 (-),score=61.60 gnl/MRDRNA2_/MRDRNA2_105406_c0_seq1:105-989(-)
MPHSSRSFAEPLIQEAAPRYGGLKVFGLLTLLIGCALLCTYQEPLANLADTVNMVWQPPKVAQSMQPMKVGQFMQRFPTWQPTNNAQSMWPVKALQQERSYPQYEVEQNQPTIAMEFPLNRRGLSIMGAILGGGAVLGGPADALIPDDEDSDLLAKAKANRKARIQAEKQAERAYVETGEKGPPKNLDRELLPVQIAIKQLGLAGADLEKGDTKAAASELTESMIGDLNKAILKVSNTNDSKALSGTVFKSIKSLQNAANSGKLKEAKSSFVATVGDLTDWAKAAQVATLLRGL